MCTDPFTPPSRSNAPKALVAAAAAVSSPVLLLIFSWWAWDVIFQNDWGQGAVLKVLLVTVFAWVSIGVGRAAVQGGGGMVGSTFGAGAVSVLLSILTVAPNFLAHTESLPGNDIGQTTLECSRLFWTGEGNPYTDDTVNPRPGLPGGYRGFHYGPGMLLSYAGGALGQKWYQINHFAWVLAMVLAGGLLAGLGGGSISGRWAAGVFFVAVLFSSPGWWKEYFQMGVNDAVPLALMGCGLLLVDKRCWIAAGVVAGIAFSAKFSPAGFLLLAMFRRGTSVRFWQGCALGAIPLWVAMAAEPGGGFRNIFLSRLYIEGTPTGLYSLLPEDSQSLLTLAGLFATVVVTLRGWSGGHQMNALLSSILVLCCIGVLAHKETHANHLTWILFFGGVLMTLGREKVWSWLACGGQSMQNGKCGENEVNKPTKLVSNPVRPPLPVGK